MKTKIIIGLILLLPVFGFSQGEWNQWYFGKYLSLDFNSGSPVQISNNAMLAIGGTISISDSLGNILFYSDGHYVWDKTNNITPNGSGLFGFWVAEQSVFCAKNIVNDSTYYLFTVGNGGSSPPHNGLHYSVFDMNLNNGLGDISPGMKNIPVPDADSAFNLLYGTRHLNNRDVWVVVKQHPVMSSTWPYMSFLLTANGFNANPVISPSYLGRNGLASNEGTIRISPDGTKLICLGQEGTNGRHGEFCQFNNISGEVNPLFLFIPSNGPYPPYSPYWAEFSEDNHYLYVSTVSSSPSALDKGLFQYDATKTDSLEFMQSETYLGYGAGSMQLGPDGKIYVNAIDVGTSADSIHIINYPSEPGVNCGFQKNILALEGNSIDNRNFPQFLQKYLLFETHQDQCEGDTVFFTSSIWPEPDSIYWDFGDPSSGGSNYSLLANPAHLYTSSGIYSVTLSVIYVDKRTDSLTKTVQIYAYPNPSLGPDTIICLGDSATFDAGACSGCAYQWTDISTGLPIGIGQTLTMSQSGTYAVAVISGGSCLGRDTIQLTVTQPPSVTNTPLTKSICAGESTFIPLTSSVPNTDFSWTAIGSSPLVIGFSPGSGDTIDQVLNNSGSSPETVTYWITPSVGSCAGDSVDYIVTVTPGDSVNISIASSADSICEGTTVTFNATTNNGGAIPSFQWKVNGISSGTNDSVFTYAPINGDSITCVLISSTTSCISNNPAVSNVIIMTVNPNLPVSISIVPYSNPVCEGIPVTFTATPTNEGSSPGYQWQVNGSNAGTNNAGFTFSPVDGDIVTCILTSSETCTSGNPASSNPVIMDVNPLLPVSISITASLNPVCGGIPVTFTAIPINGGSLPEYQWQVNGGNTGGNSPNFTYLPIDGDVVSCILTSNEDCVTGNPARSNQISMSIGEQPDVSFSACFDTLTTLNAKSFKLKGGIPLRGVYSGPGVDQITGYFNPALAGVGVHQVSYTYTNFALCSNVDFLTVDVSFPAPFTCGSNLLDIRDNTIYPTVLIGSQCWMAANLDYGSEIPHNVPQRDNCVPEKYKLAVGSGQWAVYQWDELMRYENAEEIQGLCPPGWHVPSEADWDQLFAFYQGNAFAGSPLKYSGYSGFNALMTGAEFFNKGWEYGGFATFFWSSTSHGPWKAWGHGLNDYNHSVSYYPSYRANAFSVRCVRD